LKEKEEYLSEEEILELLIDGSSTSNHNLYELEIPKGEYNGNF
jgi:hypothetical protein